MRRSPRPDAIKETRTIAGMTQEEAAQEVSAHRRTWIRWEQGTTPMPLAKWGLFLIKVKKRLGLD